MADWSEKHTNILRRQFVGIDTDFPAVLNWAQGTIHPGSAEMLMLSHNGLCVDWRDGEAKFVPSRGTHSN